MIPPQDVAPPVEQKIPEFEEQQVEQEKAGGAEQELKEQDMDQAMVSPTMQHQMELSMNQHLQGHQQMEPQQLLLQCQLCAGLSVLMSDQIQPGAEIGCGFCGSPSVIIQDTTVPPSMPIDYSYAPPIDLFSSLSLGDGMGNMGMMDMNTAQMPNMFVDPMLQFGGSMMMDQFQNHQMFGTPEQQMQMPQETPIPVPQVPEPIQQEKPAEEAQAQAPVVVAAEGGAATEGENGGEAMGRGRRRPLPTPSPGLENEMKRRSWVVSNLREQHEEFMRMLDEEEKAEEARLSPDATQQPTEGNKQNALQAAQDKLTSNGDGSATQKANGTDESEVDAMQAHMIGTMMALRQHMQQSSPEEQYRFEDAEDDNMMVDAAPAPGNTRGPGGDTSSDEESQIFATPEQAEQMKRRRQELKRDDKEKERAKRWRMSGMGSLGVDRRSVGAVS